MRAACAAAGDGVIRGYISGSSWIHRIPAGVKLAALALITWALFWTERAVTTGPALCMALALYLSVGRSAWGRLRSLAFLLPVFAFIALLQVIFSGPEPSFVAVSRLMTAYLLADLVTATTPMMSMIDAFLWALRPLKFLGVQTQSIALAFALVLRFVPFLMSDWERRREAWRARGGRGAGWALVPAWIADVVRLSDRIAEALDARGAHNDSRSKHAKP